jgi:hypothetical protein
MREVNYWRWNREAVALMTFALGLFPFMAFSPQIAGAIWKDASNAMVACFAAWIGYGLVLLTWYAAYMERANAQKRRLISFNQTWPRTTSPTE